MSPKGVTMPQWVNIGTENRELSWCQFCSHWRHRRLSLRQPPVPSVTTKLVSRFCISLSLILTFGGSLLHTKKKCPAIYLYIVAGMLHHTHFCLTDWGLDKKWPSVCRRHFQVHFLEWKWLYLIEVLLPRIINTSPLVTVMAWRRTGDKPFTQNNVEKVCDAIWCH